VIESGRNTIIAFPGSSNEMNESEELYRVVFAGQITGDYPLAKTKQRFGKVFKLEPDKVDKVFNGREITLKSNISEDRAMDFAVKLAEIGCETYIEVVPSKEALGFEERRKTIRRIQFRRGPRPGAIVPDRRLTPSRRTVDLEALETQGHFPGMSIQSGQAN
jgi:hypothetical protein